MTERLNSPYGRNQRSRRGKDYEDDFHGLYEKVVQIGSQRFVVSHVTVTFHDRQTGPEWSRSDSYLPRQNRTVLELTLESLDPMVRRAKGEPAPPPPTYTWNTLHGADEGDYYEQEEAPKQLPPPRIVTLEEGKDG